LRFRVTPEGTLTDAPADQDGADAAKDGKREALIKIVAKLVGLPYDILWQRDVKAPRRRMAVYAAVAVVAVAAGVFGYTSLRVREDVKEGFKACERAAQTRRHAPVKAAAR
jgi:hypothetical protein